MNEWLLFVGERLRDKTVPCQVQSRLMQGMTVSFPCGVHLDRMGLCWHPVSTSSEAMGGRSPRKVWTEWSWNTGPHSVCVLLSPSETGYIGAPSLLEASSAGKKRQRHQSLRGVTFLTLEGEQSMQTFWKKTCWELYRRTTLTETQIYEAMWKVTWPWEDQ
jgi:hypothetical protein